MPRWIYNRPPEKCQSSELRFAQLLNDVLTDDWVVRWGYWYEDSAGTTREGDFLVLGPYGGMAVFEVKTSLGYHAKTGGWNTYDRDNPAFQLLSQHKAVVSRLKKYATNGATPYVAKALVFPVTDIDNSLDEYQGIPRKLILSGNDLRDFYRAWDRLFGWKRKVVEKSHRETFMETYGKSIHAETMKGFVSETDELILRQTTASYQLLDMLAGNQQLVIEGGVGTGKSWLALESARRLAENREGDAGREVLMMGYNLALCERLRSHVAKLNLSRGSITVQSSEALATSLLEAAKVQYEIPSDPAAKATYYDETLPKLALECLHASSSKSYDALVVDEAQDHDTTLSSGDEDTDQVGWWSIYTALLREGWQAPMALFGDANQRPPFRASNRFDWSRIRGKLGQHAQVKLLQSMRYTRPIFQFLKTLDQEGSEGLAAGLQASGKLLDGPEVVIRCGTPQETVKQVEKILREWEDDGLCDPGKVLILYARSNIDNTVLSGLEELHGRGLRPYLDTLDSNGEEYIGHSSIHKAKGLDALAVILVGLRAYVDLKMPNDRFTYFMGASRARQLLAVVHVSDDEVTEVTPTS